MSDEQLIARHLIVHGRVQGVFYRDWTVKTARESGLVGWVRNLPDGTVEAHIEGASGSVDRMVSAMRQGPPGADPTRIEQAEAPICKFPTFDRRA